MKRTIQICVAAVVLCLGARAYGASQNTIGYVSDTDHAQLLTVDLATGQATVVGNFGIVSNVSGLAYDPADDVMYGISAVADTLYTIDMDTGAATHVGGFGLSENITMQGLAYDTRTNTLYSSASTQRTLYTIDVATGAASAVASTSTARISGLAIDLVNDILYGSPASQLGGGVFTIDKTTGTATQVGTGTLGFNGLAFDPLTETLFGVRNLDHSLYRIDTVTGQGTLIGNLGINGNPLGFEIVPEPMSATLLLMGTMVVLRIRRR